MINRIWTGTCAAIAGTATVVAMAQAPPQQPGSTTSEGRRITVTGCLKQAPGATPGTAGTAGTTGTTGTTGTAAAPGVANGSTDVRFILTGATTTPADVAPGSASATPGSAAQSGAGETAQTYRLVANPAALSPHVGKKVQLTGTLVDQPGSSSAAPSATPASSENGPALRVEGGKVIAASCQE